jgi:hypothetical protein
MRIEQEMHIMSGVVCVHAEIIVVTIKNDEEICRLAKLSLSL